MVQGSVVYEKWDSWRRVAIYFGEIDKQKHFVSEYKMVYKLEEEVGAVPPFGSQLLPKLQIQIVLLAKDYVLYITSRTFSLSLPS